MNPRAPDLSLPIVGQAKSVFTQNNTSAPPGQVRPIFIKATVEKDRIVLHPNFDRADTDRQHKPPLLPAPATIGGNVTCWVMITCACTLMGIAILFVFSQTQQLTAVFAGLAALLWVAVLLVRIKQLRDRRIIEFYRQLHKQP